MLQELFLCHRNFWMILTWRVLTRKIWQNSFTIFQQIRKISYWVTPFWSCFWMLVAKVHCKEFLKNSEMNDADRKNQMALQFFWNFYGILTIQFKSKKKLVSSISIFPLGTFQREVVTMEFLKNSWRILTGLWSKKH